MKENFFFSGGNSMTVVFKLLSREFKGVSRATLRGSASKFLYNEIGKCNLDYCNRFFFISSQSFCVIRVDFFQCELRIIKFDCV